LPTKEASQSAANQWWAAKQKALDVKPEPDPWQKFRDGIEAATGIKPTSRAALFATLMQFFNMEDLPEAFTERVLGREKMDLIEQQVTGAIIGSRVNPERSVIGQIARWVEVLKASATAGTMSIARFHGYSSCICHFRNFMGEGATIDQINPAKLEGFWTELLGRLGRKEISTPYAQQLWLTARQFITRLVELELIPLPANMHSRRFRFGTAVKPIEIFSDAEVRTILAAATERTRLLVLLMLNCGMYQSDIADLGTNEVDWQAGTITRPRTKRPGGMVTRYQLWPETFALLKKYRASKQVLNARGFARLLLTGEGNPLTSFAIKDGKVSHYDAVKGIWRTVMDKTKIRKPPKLFRKTAATKLGEHEGYKYYQSYYLSHAPKSMADRHYTIPSDTEFFAALAWLRSCWLA
jgi:integrase